MKKIYSFVAILLLIGTLSSCRSDLLDTYPYDSVASGNMWTTDGLTDQGVTGVYQTLKLEQGGNGYDLYQYDLLGGGSTCRVNEAKSPLVLGTATAGSGVFATVWKIFYEGIHRANDAITNIPLKSPSSEEKKARYVAECKFLRAYFYYRLNQLYKGVPVYLEPVDAEEANRGRETEEAVWEMIISDLTDCINEPNLPNKYNAGDGNYGHVTKGAAYTLRGKVYMYMKQWDKAIADFEAVGKCGYSLFQGSYKELFKERNEQCDEMIFSIQNAAVDGYGSHTQFYCGTRSSYGSCWEHYVVSTALVDEYENIDGTKFDWDDIVPGYDSLSDNAREAVFIRDDATPEELEAAKNRGADLSLYLGEGNESRIRKAYENRDPRLLETVITPYSTYLGSYEERDVPVVKRWPYRGPSTETGDLQETQTTFFFYNHRKFVYEGASETLSRTYGPTDEPIFRYADVVLNLAEAMAEKGESLNTIVELINSVRTRAKDSQGRSLKSLQTTDPSSATFVGDYQNVIERIRYERRMEFVNEGVNYFDELRWGTWKESKFGPAAGCKQIWGTNTIDYVYGGNHYTTWPVPLTEVQKNSNLAPTEGWIY